MVGSQYQLIFHQVFTSFRNDRSGKGGVVFLLVSNKFFNLKSQELEELKAGDECEVVWVKIKVHRPKISTMVHSTDHQTIITLISFDTYRST